MEIPQIAWLHLVTGSGAVLAVAAAFLFPKGRGLHRFAGHVFTVCMIALALSGIYLSFTRSILFTAFLGLLALYLVATGWVAARRKDGTTGLFEATAMMAILLGALACAISGFLTPAGDAAPQDALPAGAYYGLAALAAFFGLSDFLVMRRGGLSGRHRIARHLWRMGFSAFIAVTIFFLGNSHVLPEGLRHPYILNAPILAVVVLTIFWFCRVRLTRWWNAQW